MYHFIGIKGSGMASLASILNDLGYEVQGSDIPKHFFTENELIKRKIEIFNYNADNITKDLTIIKGASIKDDNVELKKAKEIGLKILEYNEMVGKLTDMFKTICICGCHGKTTTTAMIATSLSEELKINYLIGDGTGYANKNNIFFALEACEYQRHFLAYNPYYTIITNIDLDHVDYFKNLDDVMDAYRTFANKTKKKVIACGDDDNIRRLNLNKNIDIIYYGINEYNNVKATNIIYKEDGIEFEVIIDSKKYGKFNLPIYGEHQLLDALAVITLAYLENIKSENINNNLAKFKGAKRRFTITSVKDSIIIDDYAHHPNEVLSTIEAAKQKYKNKKIIIIFQPHTFSRTKEFAKDFIKIFKRVDYAYLLDIFPAREKQEDYKEITSHIITDNLENSEIITLEDAKKLSKYKNSVYLFMSPNDISKLEKDLIKELQNN